MQIDETRRAGLRAGLGDVTVSRPISRSVIRLGQNRVVALMKPCSPGKRLGDYPRSVDVNIRNAIMMDQQRVLTHNYGR